MSWLERSLAVCAARDDKRRRRIPHGSDCFPPTDLSLVLVALAFFDAVLGRD